MHVNGTSNVDGLSACPMFPCDSRLYINPSTVSRILLVVCSAALLNCVLSQLHGPLDPHGPVDPHGPLDPHGPSIHGAGPIPDGPHAIHGAGPIHDGPGPHLIPDGPHGPNVSPVINPLLPDGLLEDNPFVDPFTEGIIPEKGPWKKHRIPLNNPGCKKIGPTDFDPKAIFDDSFVCDKSAESSLPITPRIWTDRHPNSTIFGDSWVSTWDFEHDPTKPLAAEFRATDFYEHVYDALVADDFGDVFKQCASRPKHYNPPETAKYKAKKTCETNYVPLHERAIWHNHQGRQLPCYVPVPNELWSVSCHSPDNPSDTKCRLGYVGYDEFRCIPSNFVQRTITLVCPTVNMMFKRTFSVPTTCSCKMCYSCGNGLTYDVRAPGHRGRRGRRRRRLGRKRDGVPIYAKRRGGRQGGRGGRGGRRGRGRIDPILH
ncbi:hypothetical protein FSP39_001748 [Pinctada imbricata]|uniref:Uncharacterized protein n=1 Tax=Pinctada imbricata TaxID=66713 RepID=A0AA88XP92_PINIB|nr:hypothetical protein FSP39_001748 [Pinctada imbricata]